MAKRLGGHRQCFETDLSLAFRHSDGFSWVRFNSLFLLVFTTTTVINIISSHLLFRYRYWANCLFQGRLAKGVVISIHILVFWKTNKGRNLSVLVEIGDQSNCWAKLDSNIWRWLRYAIFCNQIPRNKQPENTWKDARPPKEARSFQEVVSGYI